MSSVIAEPLRTAIEPAKQEAMRHFGVHPYFTKRAWNVVQAYISHFSAPGGTVLDPFGGSGVTATESLVLRRKAIYVDISEWACFLARQTAIAPVDLGRLAEAFAQVEKSCRSLLERLWSDDNHSVVTGPIQDWYPKDVPLPTNADVGFVEELFTPRMLRGLSRLRSAIMEVSDPRSRDLLLLAFSSTLARINRTFLSAANRRESRGGSAIFSIYRYKVAKKPVELPLWDQFAKRFERLFSAKKETNQLIGDFYREGRTAVFRHGSATQLEWIEPESVDYIYTDPPYGANIAYLDLSTMWAAWLGFTISPTDRAEEVIEGGQLNKSREVYQHLLKASLEQMYRTLKTGAWMSIVFAHRDTAYWDSLVEACADAGLEYVNTVVQPVGVVWSMHKKKNPLRVLSGELVLNFRKPRHGGRKRKPKAADGAPMQLVRKRCERVILSRAGAPTEALHHAVIPELLEKGLLGAFSRAHGDLTPILAELFHFDRSTNKWHLREGHRLSVRASSRALARYHVIRLLEQRERDHRPPTTSQVHRHVESLGIDGRVSESSVRHVLAEVAYSPDNLHWRLSRPNRQQAFLFAT